MAKAEPDQMVDEIEQIRERLAGTIDQLIDRSHPKAIAGRAAAKVKARFVDETGSPRLETIGPVVGVAVAVVAGAIVLRRLLR